MQLAPGPTIVPPQGRLIYDKDGEHVESMTREGLINDLTELRLANGKEIGDPERAVDQVLVGVVGYSSPIPVQAIEPKPHPRARLIDKVNSWLMNQYSRRGTLKFVNALEANRRANICVKCPRNKPWEDSCRTCNAHSKAAIRRNVVVLSQNKKTKVHENLFACSATGQENKLAVFLDPACLERRERFIDNLPQFCWLKSL